MGRIGYEEHYGVSSYHTSIEEVAALVPERYHGPILDRVAELDMWLQHYGFSRADHINTQNAMFLQDLRGLISGLSTACFRYLKGQYVHGEDWSCLIEKELAIDILDAKYHPLQLADLPESVIIRHPLHGRKLSHVHREQGLTVAIEWDYLGEWPNHWIAFYPSIELEALEQIGSSKQEAVEAVKEAIARFKVNHIDHRYYRYSREDLEKMSNRSLRYLARDRGIRKAATMRVANLINAILAVHQQPSFDYPAKRSQVLQKEGSSTFRVEFMK